MRNALSLSLYRLARLTFEGSLVQNARSGDFRGSLLKEVSYKALVLETSAAQFGGSLVRYARSGDFRGSLLEEVSYETLVLETSAAHFWRKSRTKRSFSLANDTFEALPNDACSKMSREIGVRLQSRRVFFSSVFQNDPCSKMSRFWVPK